MSYTRRDYYGEKNGVTAHPSQREDDEKSRLQEPVKLRPSWEENNLPEEELNFKSLTMDEASLQLNTPPDRYSLVYITFLIHGIGVLMPWNMFINAQDYFTTHKLQGYEHLPNFMQYLTFCSQVPNVIFNYMNIFVKIGGNLTTRIVWSICIALVVFIVTVILAMVDTEHMKHEFFWITMVSVIILNMANGIYQNTIYGMAAKLPPKYTGSVVLGSNISGAFTAVVSILSKKMASDKRMAAIYYFITAIFTLLICFDTYFALPLNRYYRHFELKEKKDAERRVAENKGIKEKIPYLRILKNSWPQLYNVFFVFFVTLAVFPSMHSNIKSQEGFFITDLYTDILCFLTFNVTAMLGSILPSLVTAPGPKYLWIPVTLRVLYIPFFLFSNYQVTDVHRTLPVLFNNDWVYWFVAVTFGLSSGYFSSIGMMYAPGTVEPRYAATAGMFAAAALITGIFSGILISFLWPWFIAHVGI
ncbi:equilibrative nucleoside transporter 1 [Aethina tumida]|uniref:equilibrative nucleoside transporter 1 n=1 Tax=Aethina tumida TaxID=116153 RepID=UPI00096B16A8|nr:equilibrative nucleoside transporter 1 [Aethina tumida]XP_049823653.1 equilibrative nucleoside transporter 1 [Aethina tumida]